MESIIRDMQTKEFNDAAMENFNMNLYEMIKRSFQKLQKN